MWININNIIPPKLWHVSTIVVCLLVTTAWADLGDEPYCLPLVGPYAIYRNDVKLVAEWERGKYQLVEVVPPLPYSSFSFSVLIPNVEQVAVEDRVIYGKTNSGFFIFDARQPKTLPQPQLFDSREKWQTSLRNSSIDVLELPPSPDVMAAKLSQRVLRPWRYRVMGGAFGLEDDLWSLIVQLAGFVLALFIGFIWPRNRLFSVLAVVVLGMAMVVLGLAVDVVAQIIIAGEGPGAFVGLFAIPLFYIQAAMIGYVVRVVVFVIRQKHNQPAGS